ncbi:nucleotidyltransferase domain-containing protein [Candidatus Pacearchaeota archaeon]|nr:nucleotidyltransferase domain-containing protein [Candidatus Pacearchaeota archaeon]
MFGYDQPRPTRNSYDLFMSDLESGLQSLGFEGLSFMIYGSYARGDHRPGISDIDGFFVFPDDVTIHKPSLKCVGEVVANALGNHAIPLQLGVTDITTMRDGRFNSYSPNFGPYFDREGKVIVGPDYRDQFRYELPEFSDQEAMKHNLRKTRECLLLSSYYSHHNQKALAEGFDKGIKAISRSSKQILAIMDGEVRSERFSGLNDLHRIFPHIDISSVERIKYLFNHLPELDKMYKNPGEMIQLLTSGVDFFENVVKSYIELVPHL